MQESSKSIARRIHDIRFTNRYFVGDGIDVGAGDDSLSNYNHLFPSMKSCRDWDMQDGDAQYLHSIPDSAFDFLHSSHCLEHMVDPLTALKNWIRVVKKSGHLIVTIPEEDLYEQGVFPSTFNTDHKWTFTLYKKQSWSPKSINVFSLLAEVSDTIRPLRCERVDTFYRFNLPRVDQTMAPGIEAAIEFICQKI